MPEQFTLFNTSTQPGAASCRRLKNRKSCELRYRNGARVIGTQDRYGLFWLVSITHKDRKAFTTTVEKPVKGAAEIERIIKTLEHH